MQHWEHLLARWVMAVLVFAAASVMTAPLSALLWRWRRHLSLSQLKSALAVVVLKPLLVALFTVFVAAMPPCTHHTTCYFGWLQQNVGSAGILLMRVLLLAMVTLFVVFAARLVIHAVTALSTLRQLHNASRPPSEALQQVLQQVVPAKERHRFRETSLCSRTDGVYAGTCFLSEQSVQTLSGVQLRAIVAHEWQHLRARDGWFALGIGLLVRSVGLGGWNAAFRRWSQAAELVADARAMQIGVPCVQLAKTLLHQQASAQGLSLGFAANSSLLEERLQSLIMPSTPVSRLTWSAWLVIAGVCLLVLYAVWSAGHASTCTIHCVLF
ncbi:MAG: hypothetical protein KatS3mg022_0163 [Armatimonadota bacterium]|nr:MAG: hypothetical protein KatS3mg022_0163 [Armatimonadota bacterium]